MFFDRNRRKEALNFIATLAIFLTLTWTATAFAVQPTKVLQTSMYPTLFENDMILLNKLAYTTCGPERGDIVVFDPPFASDRSLIKRVIGLPGEWVGIQGDAFYINGNKLSEEVVKTKTNYKVEFNIDRKSGTLLGPEEYFVAGDNRDVSYDSRSFGPIKRKAILGKAEVVFWPANHFHILP